AIQGTRLGLIVEGSGKSGASDAAAVAAAIATSAISCGARIGLTTQAQRPGPWDASIATRARWPGSLQRLVRHHITDESMFPYAENVWLPSRLIPHRHRPRAELQPAYELQVDMLR